MVFGVVLLGRLGHSFYNLDIKLLCQSLFHETFILVSKMGFWV